MDDPDKALDYSVEDGEIQISLPANAPDGDDSVVVLDVVGVP